MPHLQWLIAVTFAIIFAIVGFVFCYLKLKVRKNSSSFMHYFKENYPNQYDELMKEKAFLFCFNDTTESRACWYAIKHKGEHSDDNLLSVYMENMSGSYFLMKRIFFCFILIFILVFIGVLLFYKV